MNQGSLYRISGVPSSIKKPEDILEALGPRPFAIMYDLNGKRSIIWLEEKDGPEAINRLSEIVPGLEFERTNEIITNEISNFKANSFYTNIGPASEPLKDIFNQGFEKGLLSFFFIPPSSRELQEAKRYLESSLSSKDLKETRLSSWGLRSRLGNVSVHRDIYQDSEEELIMKKILESINDSLLKNNLLYKIFLIYDSNDTKVQKYLKERLVLLSEKNISVNKIGDLIIKLSKMRSFPFGASYCSSFLKFYGADRLNKIVKTNNIFSKCDGLLIGKLMNEGVYETVEEVRLDKSSLNLGTLVTGLPGSGKTAATMHLLEEIISEKGVPVFVLAPTEEWNTFAISNEIPLISIFRDENRINFFRCIGEPYKERFCQDLSMVLSAASGAGPYRRPMEKCILNAFRRSYKDTTEPDPIEIYEEIEESIIRFHGKRTNTGIKYTKHGENVKAALESLRIILSDSLYSSKIGIHFEDLMTSGAVFDISNTSIATKPFLYAMILNQIYSLASMFDTKGDEKLRMLICVEESQIIFKDEDSPAVIDIKHRIQDFRKRGIGIILLAHNILDVDPEIRRLCQIKLYFKQSPDLAYVAAKELIFTGIENEIIVDKLKTLNSRIAAFTAVSRKSSQRIQEETILVKSAEYMPKEASSMQILKQKESEKSKEPPTECIISLEYDQGKNNNKPDCLTIRISYLGDMIAESKPQNMKLKCNLLKGRKYRITILNEKGRILDEIKIEAKDRVSLFLNSDGLKEIFDYPII